jgi:FkbM family methyltransferase
MAIEPSPASLSALERNISLNDIGDRVRIARVAAGAGTGRIKISTAFDSLNHVVPAGETTRADDVPMESLDRLLGEETPILIKIDVEGYESEVLSGAPRLLADPGLKAIIIELNGSGERYGVSDAAVHARLCELGFAASRYDPLTRHLAPASTFGRHNTLYIRDSAFVSERLAHALPFSVLGQRI